MFIVEFVPEAAAQAAEAQAWWRAHRDKAPFAFEDDLTELVTMLEQVPRAVGGSVSARPGVRRAVLRRVRYNVYFTVEASTVLIVAVWHASRGTLPDL
jgi:plasmid stabilization system protein ParE